MQSYFSFQYTPECFEKDGKTLTSANSHAHLSSLVRESDAAEKVFSADEEKRINQVESAQVVTQGRLDVMQSEIDSIRREAQIETAKAEEEKDGRINERLNLLYLI